MARSTTHARVTHLEYRHVRSYNRDSPRETQRRNETHQLVELDENGERHFTCDTCRMALHVQRKSNEQFAAETSKRRRRGARCLAWSVVVTPLGILGCIAPSVWGAWSIWLAVFGGPLALMSLAAFAFGLVDVLKKPQRVNINSESEAETTAPNGWQFAHIVGIPKKH